MSELIFLSLFERSNSLSRPFDNSSASYCIRALVSLSWFLYLPLFLPSTFFYLLLAYYLSSHSSFTSVYLVFSSSINPSLLSSSHSSLFLFFPSTSLFLSSVLGIPTAHERGFRCRNYQNSSYQGKKWSRLFASSCIWYFIALKKIGILWKL